MTETATPTVIEKTRDTELTRPEVLWCPWCGEDTGGEFCDTACMRAYWDDVRKAR
jgi:hypothetical protein